jgi:hypothetical protein
MITFGARISLWIVALFASSHECLAHIQVAPGTYEVPALVVQDDGKRHNAIFNLGTYSELRLTLSGAQTQRLPQKKIQGLVLKLRITKGIAGPTGSAELLGFSEIKPNSSFPAQVGNHFKPIPP